MVTPVALPPEGAQSERLIGGIPLASLVRDFHRPMVNFARTMVNSATVAEEAVQEAWVQVLQSADSFEGRSSMGTWLFGIVKNTASRHRRRESRIRDHEVLTATDVDAADPLSGRMHPPGHADAGAGLSIGADARCNRARLAGIAVGLLAGGGVFLLLSAVPVIVPVLRARR